MKKQLIFALLFGVLQLSYSIRIHCDKNNLPSCKKEVGRLLDRGFKVAHTTALTRIAHRFIDVARDLIKQFQQDQEYVNHLRTLIENLKTELNRIHEKWQDNDELVKIVKRILTQIQKDALKSNKVSEETINKALEEREWRKTIKDAEHVLFEEVTFHLSETNQELRDHNIQIDEVEQPIDELLRALKTTKDHDERMDKLFETIEKLTQTLDNMRYTIGLDLENFNTFRKNL